MVLGIMRQLLLLLLCLNVGFCLAQPINKTTTATTGTKIYRGIDAPGSGCDCGSTNSASPCTGTSVTKNLSGPLATSQIKFSFTCEGGGPCACGKFANGYDFWVAPNTAGGTVNIIAMTPAVEGAADSTLRNGWVANPSAVTTNSFMDGRLGGGTGTGTPLNPSAGSPVSINTTTTPVTTVVKSRSRTSVGSCGDTDSVGLLRYCLLHAEVLTVLDSVPTNAGSTILRPPITGTEKPLISTSSIDLTLLPELAAPTRPDGIVVYPFGAANMYNAITTALDLLAPPKVEWGADGDWTYWQYMPPYLNFGRSSTGYPSAKMENLLESLQLLTIDPGSYTSEKNLIAIRVVQWGIDYYYMWKSRNYGAMYKTNGGHSVGRYQPTLVAAGLLTGTVGDAMKTDLQKMNDGTANRCAFDVGNVMWYFADTGRTVYGVYNITGCGGYSDYTKQKNSLYIDPNHFGDNGRLTINADNDAGDVSTCSGAYQGINNGPMMGTMNLIKAIPALRPIQFNLLEGYFFQRLDHGSYCRSDQTGAYESGTRGAFWGECSGGTNSGWGCRSSSDCSGGGSCIRDADVQYTSWFGWNMINKYRSCYDAKTCAGMEGL